MGAPSFLTSFFNIALTQSVNLINGFIIQPLTKYTIGSFFTNSLFPINYIDSNNTYQLGNSYTSNSPLNQPSYTPAQTYQPGNTTPPVSYPTTQNGYTVPLGTNPASMYQFSAEGIRMVKSWEHLHQRPYKIGNQNYIGYGHRLSSSDTVDGQSVASYVSIDQANLLLAADIATAVGSVQGAITAKITQGQFDAMVDFAFTIASSKFSGSDVVSKLNSGDIPGACTALAQWVYVIQNGILVKVPHLVNRRTVDIFWMTQPTTVRPPS